MTSSTASARRAFVSLLLLALLVVAALLLLLVWQAPSLAQGMWLACESLLSALAGLLPMAGLLLPAALLAMAVLLGGGSLGLQLWHTFRLLRALEPQCRELSPEMQSMAAELGLSGRLVVVDDGTPYTFSAGLLHPRVWLSTGLISLLSPEELDAVLRHERHHIDRRDPLRVLISRALAHALFFLPVARALRDSFLLAKEVDADVASGTDEWLAMALLKLVQAGASLPPKASLAAIGPMDITGARIERLVRRERAGQIVIGRRSLWLSLFLGLAVVVTTSAASAWAAAPLTGGKCGYSTGSELNPPGRDMPPAPVEYTPADWMASDDPAF